MRRKEKEIVDRSEIEAIIKNSIVCRIGLSDGDMPYIVPVCFGFDDNFLYMHGALGGKKIAILKKNNKVCFEFEVDTEIVKAENGCDWNMSYQSVIGFGNAFFIEELKEKKKALNIIMSQYSDNKWEFPEGSIKKMSVIKIVINKMTGKQSGF